MMSGMVAISIAEFDDVSSAELHPLLTALKVIKDEYSFVKPEVYRTLIAVLYDYNPSYGKEHRSKVRNAHERA
jgi:hypothetical protein